MFSKKTATLYLLALIIGVFTGAVASLFQLGVSKFSDFILKLRDINSLITILVICSSVLISWLIVIKFSPEASGSGIPEIEGVLQDKRQIYWKRLIPVKFFAGILSVGSHLVAGREGPSIQIGGNIAAMFGDFFKIPKEELKPLIAAGAAAGLAAAFNAPIAGIIFVLEELREGFEFSFNNFKLVTLATLMSTITLNYIVGNQHMIVMPIINTLPLDTLWKFMPLGIMIGLISLFVNINLMKILDLVENIFKNNKIIFVLLMGLITSLLFIYNPVIVGSGYQLIADAFNEHLSIMLLLALCFGRIFLMMGTYSIGTPGGIFTPMLSIGTVLGSALYLIFSMFINLDGIPPDVFALAAMSGLFAASIQAPLTGTILIMELTQNYQVVLPIFIANLTASMILQLADNPALYTQLLLRKLKTIN